MIFLPLSPVSASGSKNMSIATSQEAVKRAVNFCQDIGQPADDVAHIEYRPLKSNDISAYWKPQWMIKFRDRTEIMVDTTGTISQYSCSPFSYYAGERDLSKKSRQETPGPLLTQAEATARARSLFHAMMLPDEVKVETITAELDAPAQSQEAETASWECTLTRSFNGIPYIDQSSVLHLNAETGQLRGSSLNFRTLPPLSSTIAISKNQAIALASRQLTMIGVKKSKCWGAREYVVGPNGFFTGVWSFASRAKVAWVGFFEASRPFVYN